MACLQQIFQEFKMKHIPREHNWTADGLVNTVCAFYMCLVFDSCSIRIWILRPLQTLVTELIFYIIKKIKKVEFSHISNYSIGLYSKIL